ncbi:MAG: Rieske (2Fe-2S) protein [Myxococcota bacterium]
MNRREALRGLAALCAGCAGAPPNGSDTAGDCVGPSSGATAGFCLVDALTVRVRGAAGLAPGEAVLAVVDDANAVIVARDDRGYYARSAICTHACCLVDLCADASCAQLLPPPDPCAVAGPADPTALCPCHGSVFRLSDGAPVVGPATAPLPAFAVSVDTGDVVVDTGATVSADVRTS